MLCELCNKPIPIQNTGKWRLQATKYCSPVHAQVARQMYSGETYHQYMLRRAKYLKKKQERRKMLHALNPGVIQVYANKHKHMV